MEVVRDVEDCQYSTFDVLQPTAENQFSILLCVTSALPSSCNCYCKLRSVCLSIRLSVRYAGRLDEMFFFDDELAPLLLFRTLEEFIWFVLSVSLFRSISLSFFISFYYILLDLRTHVVA